MISSTVKALCESSTKFKPMLTTWQAVRPPRPSTRARRRRPPICCGLFVTKKTGWYGCNPPNKYWKVFLGFDFLETFRKPINHKKYSCPWSPLIGCFCLDIHPYLDRWASPIFWEKFRHHQSSSQDSQLCQKGSKMIHDDSATRTLCIFFRNMASWHPGTSVARDSRNEMAIERDKLWGPCYVKKALWLDEHIWSHMYIHTVTQSFTHVYVYMYNIYIYRMI